ncbi:hypothetical protein ACWDXD_23545 [Streptomyces sp. NPDC003314]
MPDGVVDQALGGPARIAVQWVAQVVADVLAGFVGPPEAGSSHPGRAGPVA